ncbi:hypothetical protein CEE44_00045 [Candidatus Woesearchaeota archaeon B3_Woes]|nr:MAG: hypothetical protein CEE44_00045 [Candidatus Woesearchaeota archaeon B3_Woes]
MIKKTLYFFMFLFLVNFVTATTLHGTIYSFDLEKRTDAIVSVDSVPPQTKVAKDGTYSFDLPFGEYTITASYNQDNSKESASENIRIEKEGSFILDLILFPSFEEEELLFEEAEQEVAEHEYFEEPNYLALIIIVILGFGIIIYLILKYKKHTKKPEVTDLTDEVIDFIKKQGGRTTQKDIRKQFPLSEAKISLVVSELEHKNLVKRIKKGRGNIIVLN